MNSSQWRRHPFKVLAIAVLAVALPLGGLVAVTGLTGPSGTSGDGSQVSLAASTLAAEFPAATGEVAVDGTIEVTDTLDGGLKRFCCIGDGGQGEGQDAMFELADGASLSNVIIGSPAGDGVHCLGSCTLTNVFWEDVGEDAATFLGTSAATTVTIDGGGAKSADDKVFQHNGGGTVTIKNFLVEDFGKLYRACGNCTESLERHVVMSNVTAVGPGKDLVAINPNFGDTAQISGITIQGDPDREITICAEFQGVPAGQEPDQVGIGPSASCQFQDSDITFE